MKATIWHNPRCGTSRKTLAILEETPGVDITIVDYLNATPGRDELMRLYARAGMTPRDGLRAKEPLAKEMGLTNADDATILTAMMAHPILIERPLVETDKGAVLARPQDKVRDIL
jgi:arsenate reductase (glutaredoxin)